MFREKTLLVLGAGASFEAGMPLGSTLKQRIRDSLHFPDDFLRTRIYTSPLQKAIFAKSGKDTDLERRYVVAASALRDALILTESIDDTLNVWRNDQYASFCGKACILDIISEEESKSKLALNTKGSINFEELRSTWYHQLFLSLQTDIDSLDSMFDNISIIDFNYDRCIQQYLMHAISQLYPMYKNVKSLVRKLKIIKPYGSLGRLGEPGSRPYGHHIDIDISMIDLIKTHSEQVEDASISDDIALAIDSSERIMFLGFAFHEQNLKLLGEKNDKAIAQNKMVFGSIYGMPPAEYSKKAEWLRDYIGLNAGGAFANFQAGDMMKQYRFPLSG